MTTVSNCVQTAIQTCISVPAAKLHDIEIDYYGTGAHSNNVIIWAIVMVALLLVALGVTYAWYKSETK